ncbi:GNAT family N-acetyltransferase [Acidisoma sp.]|uniref:GNAT family N-acetyltransferase n=1 Tax=Acidisoma sp. TaxID=1872115 RepID=UPI003B00D99B
MTGLLTPRLRLRPWRAEDRAPFAAINAEPAVARHLSPTSRALSDALLDRIDQHFAGHSWGFWAVEDRATETLIGLCGLAHIPWEAFFTPAVEIGWRLSTDWQRRGLAREAAEASLDFAFGTLGLDRVVAFTVPANTASWGLMERLGMRRIGEFDHPNVAEGDPLRAHVAYEITAPAGRAAPST